MKKQIFAERGLFCFGFLDFTGQIETSNRAKVLSNIISMLKDYKINDLICLQNTVNKSTYIAIQNKIISFTRRIKSCLRLVTKTSKLHFKVSSSTKAFTYANLT